MKSLCPFSVGIGTIIGIVIMTIVYSFIVDFSVSRFQYKAIQNNAAQYDPITGKFEWKNETTVQPK